jgi:hypothetical protein
MHQLIKAMTVAGTVATGLPLLTEAAKAQTIYSWYQFNPLYCETGAYRNANGGKSTYLTIVVNLNGSAYSIYIPPDSQLISSLFQSCFDGSGFYAWYNGAGDGWTDFYTYPGLR